MWMSFKELPPLLKFLTVHAVACVFLLLGSIIPHDSFSIDGQPVTYAEWWASGTGLYASLLGIIMPVAAYLIFNRMRYARSTYLVALSIGIVVPYLYWGQLLNAAIGVAIVGLFGWYLYGAGSVRGYFASNYSSDTDATRRST